MFVQHIHDRLTVRMLKTSDAEPLYQLIKQSKPYLRQWLPWIDDGVTLSYCEELIENNFLAHATRSSLTIGVFYDGRIVGIVTFNKYNWRNRIGYIGYWLGEPYQGKGIMTESVKALIQYGFTKLRLNRVEIHCATENIKSQAIPKRLGFKKEGHLREAEWLYDHFVDHFVYGLLTSDWQ
ncbi:MAG TPA: GNAT family protein [Bacillota bacterium]|nr:GNAT family protein [Bacillota bacterium]